MFPTWFERRTGFTFRDPDGDLVVVLGDGGWRKSEAAIVEARSAESDTTIHVGTTFMLNFMPNTLVGAYLYKNEWHLFDLNNQSQDWWELSSRE